MTEAILALVAEHGALIVLAATFASCMAVPIPSSLALMAAGSFVATGEMALAAAVGAGLVGAIVGDQAGYWLGALGGPRMEDLARRRGMAPVLAAARDFSERWGGWSVFLSRWLFSPLGPSINLISGMIRAPWRPFTLFAVLGEIVWVALYVALGFAFSRSIVAIAALTGDLTWFLVAGGAALVFALALRRRTVRLRRERAGQFGR